MGPIGYLTIRDVLIWSAEGNNQNNGKMRRIVAVGSFQHFSYTTFRIDGWLFLYALLPRHDAAIVLLTKSRNTRLNGKAMGHICVLQDYFPD